MNLHDPSLAEDPSQICGVEHGIMNGFNGCQDVLYSVIWNGSSGKGESLIICRTVLNSLSI